MVVAAYPIIRQGLKALVQQNSDLHLIGEARSVSEAASSIRVQRPDVLLFHAEQADDGAVEIGQLAKAFQGIKILAVSASLGEPEILNALAAGAHGVLARDLNGEEMGQAIRAVNANMIVLEGAAARLLVTRLRPLASTEGIDPLTDRELQVLGLLARGHGNRLIASELGITEHTVKFHIGALLGKLRAANRTEAVSLALQYGLVTL